MRYADPPSVSPIQRLVISPCHTTSPIAHHSGAIRPSIRRPSNDQKGMRIAFPVMRPTRKPCVPIHTVHPASASDGTRARACLSGQPPLTGIMVHAVRSSHKSMAQTLPPLRSSQVLARLTLDHRSSSIRQSSLHPLAHTVSSSQFSYKTVVPCHCLSFAPFFH